MTEVHLDDMLLVNRCQQGDREALNTLIRKHQNRAYQYAYRLTRDADLACDIVAEAFARVHRSAAGFKGDSQFSTWLFRIMTNCYLDIRKRELSRATTSLDEKVHDDDSELEKQIVDTAPTPFQQALDSSRDRVIWQAVQRLPKNQKAMIVMYHVQMLSYEEIAQALSLPIGTVKSRLNRARLSLKALLRDQAEFFEAA